MIFHIFIEQFGNFARNLRNRYKKTIHGDEEKKTQAPIRTDPEQKQEVFLSICFDVVE
jgi:hypothetical protein